MLLLLLGHDGVDVLSPEFITRGYSNAEFVTILYRAFFNRAPDSGGYSYWLATLDQGTSREQVLDGFIGSAEFRNLCDQYGIRPQ